jgi:hypothetical protein
MRLVSHRRVPGYPLFVSYSILEEEVLREVHRRALLFLIGAAVVTLASLAIAALVISALRQRERQALELAASKARLEEAQRVAKIGDWAHRFADDKVIWSPQLYEMYERDPELGPLRDVSTSLWRRTLLSRSPTAITSSFCANGECDRAHTLKALPKT